MKSFFTQQLDPDQIRQGLLSIRNTQLELLNELKAQTQILKNYSPTTHSQYSSAEHKWERFPSFCLQSPSRQLQTDLGGRVSNVKDLKQQINYLKNENKLLNSNILKLKKNCEASKQLNNELQSSFNFASKLFYHILNRILQGDNCKSIAQFSYNQICKCDSTRLRDCFQNILVLLRQKQGINEDSKIKNNEGENSIASQLIDLKSQISLLLNQSNRFDNNISPKQIDKMKQQIQNKNLIIEDQAQIIQSKEILIKKQQNQLKEMRQNWQRQINERKIVMNDWEKLVKQSKTWQQKQKKIIFYAKDMENKANKFQKMVKEKDNSDSIYKENCNKLSQSIALLRETNQALRNQVKSLEQAKEKNSHQLLQQKRHLQNSLKQMRLQQQKLLQNKEIQLNSLRSHLFQIKKNQESLKELERRNKANDYMQQEVYWKKVQIVRTNSTIEHLWQVKEVEYQGINELISRLKK